MALPTSGPLTLAQIQTEFGGSNPISLSEYYAGGANVPSGTTGTYGAVPSSGEISIRNFYGTAKSTRKTVTYTFTTTTANATLNLASLSNYLAGESDITITINSGVYLYSTDIAVHGLTLSGGTTGDTLTIVNNGYIMGKGGNTTVWNSNSSVGIEKVADKQAGGPALSLSYSATINNQSGYIGGGGGAGGDIDTDSIVTSGAGAGGGESRSILNGTTYVAAGGSPGSAGQNGGYITSAYQVIFTGGGGGRIMPGTGGAAVVLAYPPANSSNSTGGLGGGAGGSGPGQNTDSKGTPLFTVGGGGGGYGASGGTGVISGYAGTVYTGAGGSGGSAGGDGSPIPSGATTGAGKAGGKAISLNGKTVTWVGGSASSSRSYGIVS